MTDSLVVQLCAAAVDQINAAKPYEYGALTAVRKFLPVLDAKDHDLRVYAVPNSKLFSDFDRDGTDETVSIDIVIQKKVANNQDNAELDPLSRLVEQIENVFRLQNIQSLQANILRLERDPLYEPERLHTLLEFVAAITITFNEIVTKG